MRLTTKSTTPLLSVVRLANIDEERTCRRYAPALESVEARVLLSCSAGPSTKTPTPTAPVETVTSNDGVGIGCDEMTCTTMAQASPSSNQNCNPDTKAIRAGVGLTIYELTS